MNLSAENMLIRRERKVKKEKGNEGSQRKQQYQPDDQDN